MINKFVGLYHKYFWILFSLVIFVGGLGYQRIWTIWFSMVFALFSLMILLLRKNKISFPKGFVIYAIFLALFLFSLFWSNNFFVSYPYFLMFLTGGLFWIIFFNLGKYRSNLTKSILLVGLTFGVLFLIQIFWGHIEVGSFGLNGYTSVSRNHHHIGDLWVLVFLIVLNKIRAANKSSMGLWPTLIMLGLFILFMSQSRSAYISLFGGLFYLINKKSMDIKSSSLVKTVLFVLILVFLQVSLNKDLIGSRIYYLQSILAITKFPLGVGVGNFGDLSGMYSTYSSGLGLYSIVTHNIVLEFLSGMGLVGLVFAYWFINVVIKSFNSKINILNNALVLSLAINFFFDMTYFIPTMLWIWFSLLGQR